MRILIAGDFSPMGRLSRLGTACAADTLGSFHAVIAESDLAIVNLECPLCEPTKAISKTGPSLNGQPEAAKFLADAGFGLVALANNHIFDYGSDGLLQTMHALRSAGIGWVGGGMDYKSAASPYYVSSNGCRVAILNFAENEWSTTRSEQPGAAPLDPVLNHISIRECLETADHVIVICHGGHELERLPSPRMVQLYRFYVDSGASAVISHHTHFTSGFEVYKEAPIFYSLGNFLFDHPGQRIGQWTQGMAVELTLTDSQLGFKVHHYSQCTDVSIFDLADADESAERDRLMLDLNQIISDPTLLGAAFEELVRKRRKQYRAYLEPTSIRWILAAQNRGLFPSLISKRRKRLLLNMLRCESHRDIVVRMLEHEISGSDS